MCAAGAHMRGLCNVCPSVSRTTSQQSARPRPEARDTGRPCYEIETTPRALHFPPTTATPQLKSRELILKPEILQSRAARRFLPSNPRETSQTRSRRREPRTSGAHGRLRTLARAADSREGRRTYHVRSRGNERTAPARLRGAPSLPLSASPLARSAARSRTRIPRRTLIFQG